MSKDVTTDEIDAMFDENDFADVDDLLNEVVEDDSEGWNPSEKGESVAGRVVKVGETRSDFAKDGEDPMCPTVTVDGNAFTPDGEKTRGKFRVIGYGSVLKRELQDADPQIGDLIAVKFYGEKPVRKGKFAGKPYRHFGVAVRRAK